MNVGQLLTAWTIRAALVCYVATLLLLLTRDASFRRWRIARALWTVGSVLFFTHFLAAFQFYHHWSHQHAFDDTAKQTKELMGWEFGQGIFVSYIFMALWMIDTAWWWFAAQSYLVRPRWLTIGLHAFLLFIAFNGVVIFKTGATRVGGIAAIVGIAAAWWIGRLNHPRREQLAPSLQNEP